MTDERFFNLRPGVRRRQSRQADTIHRIDGTPERPTNIAAIELLGSLRGVRPEVVRSLAAGTPVPEHTGPTLRLAFATLPSKILRR